MAERRMRGRLFGSWVRGFGAFLRGFGSLKLSVVLLAALVAVVFIGTLYQVDKGMYLAQEVFFFSWFTTQWIIPLPGGQLLLWLLGVNLMVSLVLRLPRVRPRLGLIISHSGLVVLMIGAFTGLYHSDSFIMALQEGATEERVYHRSDWDLVVYEFPGGGELGRIGLETIREGRAEPLNLAGGLQITLTFESIYRNSRRVSDSQLEELPLDDEVIRNFPGVRGSVEIAGRNVPLVLHGGDQGVAALGAAEGLQGREIGVFLEPRSVALPFSVTLEDFEALFHPGTDVPASFASDVRIRHSRGDGIDLEARISMNSPLRHGGYTFYQSSYRQADPELGIARDLSVFAVRRDGTAWLPYAGTLITVLGLVVHLFQRLGRRGGRRGRGGSRMPRAALPGGGRDGGGGSGRRAVFGSGVVAVLLAVASGLGYAQLPEGEVGEVFPSGSPGGDVHQGAAETLGWGEAPDLSGLIVQQSGRTMPLNSLAPGLVRNLSGKTGVEGYTPEQIISAMIRGEDAVLDLPLFLVDNPGVFPVLQLPFEQRGRYSYRELQGGLGILERIQDVITQREAAGTEDALELELIRLFRRGRLFDQVFTAPQNGGYGDSILTLVPLEQRVSNQAGYRWVDPRSALELLDSPGYRLPEVEQDSRSDSGGQRDTRIRALIEQMAGLDWGRLEQQQAELLNLLGLGNYKIRGEMESLYRRVNPVFWAMVSTGLGLSIGWLSARRQWVMPQGGSVSGDRMYRFGRVGELILLWGGVAFVTGALVLRVIITRRPPVTDLSSSVLFVGATAVLVGAVLRTWGVGRFGSPGQLAGWFALALLGLSRYLLGSGDELGVIQAVLDTNLWLSVHVLTIASGYTAVLLGGITANAYTLTAVIRPRADRFLQMLYRVMYVSLLAGLVLSFFGTMLGGFWADQAWGRFWGWDPKENGALMIVLWTAMVLHIRPAGFGGSYGTALVAGFGVAVTAFSWFGVNLIGQGLHSYGFSTRTLMPLVVSLLAELVILGVGLGGMRRYRWAQLLPREVLGRVDSRITLDDETMHLWIRVGTEDHGRLVSQYRPGQYMTLGLDRWGSIQRRVFSISGVEEGRWRFTLRDSGNRGVSQGLMKAPLGTRVGVLGPGGDLHGPDLEDPPGGKMMAAVQGVGIGPVLPILQALLPRGWSACILWAGSWEDEELAGLSRDFPGALELRRFDGTHRLDLGRVRAAQEEFRIPDNRVLIVGSQEFVDSFDVPDAQREAFIASRNSAGGAVPISQRSHTLGIAGMARTVHVAAGQNLLSAMVEAGVDAPFGCAGGQCGECKARVVSGRVAMELPNMLGRSVTGPGEDTLTCAAYPLEDVTLDISEE